MLSGIDPFVRYSAPFKLRKERTEPVRVLVKYSNWLYMFTHKFANLVFVDGVVAGQSSIGLLTRLDRYTKTVLTGWQRAGGVDSEGARRIDRLVEIDRNFSIDWLTGVQEPGCTVGSSVAGQVTEYDEKLSLPNLDRLERVVPTIEGEPKQARAPVCLNITKDVDDWNFAGRLVRNEARRHSILLPDRVPAETGEMTAGGAVLIL